MTYPSIVSDVLLGDEEIRLDPSRGWEINLLIVIIVTLKEMGVSDSAH